MKYNYETLKKIAKERGEKVTDLLALAPQNDPFYTGTPSELEGANWFTSLWRRFGYSTGVHLRRAHYRIVSQSEPVIMPNGKPYENTENCWCYMTMAAKWARYLGLIDPDSLVDKRNPDPAIYAQWENEADPDPDYSIEGDWEDSIEYYYKLPDLPDLESLPGELPDLPRLSADGYTDIQQAYHVELWVEKTTMNDVLEPLCRRYGANLVTGAGELSITAVRQFLQRVQAAGRPARILYISDYDPAGVGMPISIARKIEFYQRNDGFDGLDIALQPIVLTADQVKEFNLPRVPVKDSDRRKANFEAGHGEGQVELDALEAIYPGQLTRIVSSAIRRYYDQWLTGQAYGVKSKLQEELDRLQQAIRAEHEEEITALGKEYRALLDDFEKTRTAFTELIQPFTPRLETYRERLENIKERAREAYTRLNDDLEAVNVDLEEYPLPEPDIDGDPPNLLYASERDYFEQLEAYDLQRNGG